MVWNFKSMKLSLETLPSYLIRCGSFSPALWKLPEQCQHKQHFSSTVLLWAASNYLSHVQHSSWSCRYPMLQIYWPWATSGWYRPESHHHIQSLRNWNEINVELLILNPVNIFFTYLELGHRSSCPETTKLSLLPSSFRRSTFDGPLQQCQQQIPDPTKRKIIHFWNYSTQRTYVP